MALRHAEPLVSASYSFCTMRSQCLDFGVQLFVGLFQAVVDFRAGFGFIVAIPLLQDAGEFFHLAAQPPTVPESVRAVV